jgi:ribose-phosphate pyrophosphokinase
MNFIIKYPEDKLGAFDMFRYPGGEVQVRLGTVVTDQIKNPIVETVTVVARITDGDIVPVAQLLNAIRGATSADILLVMPYLPYGRADRRFTLGDCNGLQVFAQLLNTFAGVDIVTLDAHSSEAAKYIRHFSDVSPKPLIQQTINLIPGSTNILLPDKGAERYGFAAVQASKLRDPETGKLTGFSVPDIRGFLGDNILIVDDICDGGGTFIGIAEALRRAGVEKHLYLYVTHGLFSKSLSPLKKYFKHVYTTDSFRVQSAYGDPEFLTVLPCIDTILKSVE